MSVKLREFNNSWRFEANHFEKMAGMWPVLIGEMMALKHYIVHRTQIHYYNFHFIREGSVRYCYGDQEIILSGGDFFAKFPNVPQTYHIVPGARPLRLIWVSFDGLQSQQLMSMAGMTQEKPYRQQGLNEGLDTILTQIIQLCRKQSPKQMIDMYGLLYNMFSHLIPAPQTETELYRGADHWIEKSLDFIHARFMSKITVSDIAGYVNVNRTHFSETFTQKMGVPPAVYLKKLKLEKGYSMLQTSHASVTEIAMELGYTDIYSFTRAFSNHFGISPSQARAAKL
jgi:AraC-like DNA-binding protein